MSDYEVISSSPDRYFIQISLHCRKIDTGCYEYVITIWRILLHCKGNPSDPPFRRKSWERQHCVGVEILRKAFWKIWILRCWFFIFAKRTVKRRWISTYVVLLKEREIYSLFASRRWCQHYSRQLYRTIVKTQGSKSHLNILSTFSQLPLSWRKLALDASRVQTKPTCINTS